MVLKHHSLTALFVESWLTPKVIIKVKLIFTLETLYNHGGFGAGIHLSGDYMEF